MVYSRLSRRLRELGHRSFGSVPAIGWSARRATPPTEWQEFVNCLTTNLTSFFREAHHFAILEAELQRRRGAPWRLWCNAASTGEEPYSLAMTVIEALGAQAPVAILASDIDTRALGAASRGIFSAGARGLSPRAAARHFLRGRGANAGLIRVKPELQRLPKISRAQPDGRALVARRGVRHRVLPQRDDLLRRADPAPGARTHARRDAAAGLLFAGHSEHFASSRDLFRLRGKTVYERV